MAKHYPLSAVAIATMLTLTACGGGGPSAGPDPDPGPDPDLVRLSSALLVTANRDSAPDGTANLLATVSGNMITLARTDYSSAEPPPAVPFSPPANCGDMDPRDECSIAEPTTPKPPGVTSTGLATINDNITVDWDPDGDIAIVIRDALRVTTVDNDIETSIILRSESRTTETERGGLLGNFREYLLSRTDISGRSASYGLIFTDRTQDQASVTDDDHLFFGIWLATGISAVKVDEDGNPVLDTSPVLEQTPVLDEDGNPVLDEDGNPVSESTRVLDKDGNPISRGYPVVVPVEDSIRYSPFAGGGDRVEAAEFRTLSSSLTGSATYLGKVAGLHTTETAGSAGDGSDDTYSVEAFYADAMLEAEFNPDTVGLSGQIDGIVSGGEMLEGSITLGDTPITTRHLFAYENPVDTSEHVTDGRVLASEATGEIGGDDSFGGFWEGMFYNHVPGMAPDSFAGTFVVGNGDQTEYFAGGYAVNKE